MWGRPVGICWGLIHFDRELTKVPNPDISPIPTPPPPYPLPPTSNPHPPASPSSCTVCTFCTFYISPVVHCTYVPDTVLHLSGCTLFNVHMPLHGCTCTLPLPTDAPCLSAAGFCYYSCTLPLYRCTLTLCSCTLPLQLQLHLASTDAPCLASLQLHFASLMLHHVSTVAPCLYTYLQLHLASTSTALPFFWSYRFPPRDLVSFNQGTLTVPCHYLIPHVPGFDSWTFLLFLHYP